MAAAMQAEVIAALLAGRDALVVSGTGSGKSFCFQVRCSLGGTFRVLVY